VAERKRRARSGDRRVDEARQLLDCREPPS
jgi:hypothetical protein